MPLFDDNKLDTKGAQCLLFSHNTPWCSPLSNRDQRPLHAVVCNWDEPSSSRRRNFLLDAALGGVGPIPLKMGDASSAAAFS